MLQDLEQRRAESGGVTAQVRAAPLQRQAPMSARRALLALVAAGIATAAGAGYWFISHRGGDPAAMPPSPTVAVTPAVQPAQPTAAVPQVLQQTLELGLLPPTTETAHSATPTPAAEHPVAVQPQDTQPKQDSNKPAAVEAEKSPKPIAEIPKPVNITEIKSVSPQQRAENAYRQAYANLQQGRLSEAEEGLRQVLQLDPRYAAARQALAALLVETKRLDRAEQLLQQGLELQPGHSGYAMTLARLQVERSDVSSALATLQNNPPAGESAEYHAFMAALLQRNERHKEAISEYQLALRSHPASGPWLLGLGISLQADNQSIKATDAFRRARQSGSLSPELQAFADQRIKALQ